MVFDKLKKWLPLFLIMFAIGFFPLANLLSRIPYDYGWTLRSIGLIANIAIFVFYLWHSKRQGRHDLELLYQLILLGAFFIRMSYAYSTNIFLRQHDVGRIALDDSGHYAYILQLFTNGKLPTTNHYQFYHPPLYHALSALWLRGVSLILPGLAIEALFDTLPIVSLIIGYLVVYVAYLIVKLKPEYHRNGLPFMLLVAFHPIFILLSGRHNNDNLSILFILLTVYFFLRFREKGKIGNAVGLGLAIGLGMMTKLTVAVITPVIAGYMIYDFVKSIVAKDAVRPWPRRLLELGIFALIVFPLGLWYPIRNYLEFGQPLGYVFLISNPNLSTAQYSFFQRFLILDLNGLVNSLYANAGADYSIWFYILKTSIFGEFAYWGAHVFSLSLFIINVALSTVLVIVFYKRFAVLFKRKDEYNELLIGYTLVLFLAYILFNLRYPFGPTMDFRYLIPIVFNIGLLLLSEKRGTALYRLSEAGIIALSALSVMFFTFLY